MAEHEWGPHERGLRWVQCSTCKCLLHDPEAKGACPGPAAVKARRALDARALWALLRRVAEREAGGR